MKKKKGFTLIELLAVIVVLAIIALIATPIVMNTIKNAKKGAAERSGESYVKQVETAMMEYRLEKGKALADGEYTIEENGNLTGGELEEALVIEMSGTKPSSGSIKIENGKIKEENISMTVGDYNVNYDTTNKVFIATEKSGNNVEVLCTANTTKVSALVYNSGDPVQTSSYNSEEVGLLAGESGSYTAGVTYTCNLGDGEITFYVLEENGDNVSLILGTNLRRASWCNSGNDNSCEADSALEYLASSTEGWKNLESSQISLPSAEQIAIASGKTFSQTSVNGIPTWLTSYTDTNIAYGYWTSTPHASSSSSAWVVGYNGYMFSDGVTSVSYVNGIRPVITIPKTQLG